MNFENQQLIYHASKEVVRNPEVRKTQFTKDFSWGFYCTAFWEQAVRWANRGTGVPIVNFYEFKPNSDLKVLKFEEMNDAWLDFIAECRSGKAHGFDIVEGPMADDTIWNFVNDFLAGNISRRQFWALAEFKHPTHQISFHTMTALQCLTFQKSEVCYDGQ